MVQGRRPRIGPRSSQVLIRRRWGLTHNLRPTQAYSRPFSRAASVALGVAHVGAPSGGDRWRRGTMATRGVRRGPTPPPGATYLRASPKKRRRKRRRGRQLGPRGGRLGREREGGSLSLASVLRPPARQSINSSVHQFVSPCCLESAPPRSAAAQPSLWQTAVVKRCWSRAPSPANRRASPRRLRTPPSRAAREVPAQKGEPAGRAQDRRGGETPGWTSS